MDVKKKHGTVLASICYRTYKVPVIKIPSGFKGGKSKRRTRKKRKH